MSNHFVHAHLLCYDDTHDEMRVNIESLSLSGKMVIALIARQQFVVLTKRS